MQLHTINPTDISIPKEAEVQKIHTENDEMSSTQHRQAVDNFMLSDSLAKGLIDDLGFVDRIPEFIKEVIDTKIWEFLYVARGVVVPYYCRYIKGTDSENFRAFITAKRPNGLGTTVETLERLLQSDPEVLRKFHGIVYEARQGERSDLNETSGSDYRKLSERQQGCIRAADRAAKAIPAVGDLLDQRLISIEVAARLGRKIKDPNNLSAEDREYVDKRDLIGVRIQEYISSYPIPDDEDKEIQYGRELNKYVKDLLDVKDRSTPVRLNNPKKASEKLLQYYQQEELRELIEYLKKGLEPAPNLDLLALKPAAPESEAESNIPVIEVAVDKTETSEISETSDIAPDKLSGADLAERLGVKFATLGNMLAPKERDKLPKWLRSRDPNGWVWQPTDEGKGPSRLFVRAQE